MNFDSIMSGGGKYWWPGDKAKFPTREEALAHEVQTRAARYKAAGRVVTEAEHLAGRLSGRADNRSAVQRELDRMFAPKMAPVDPLDKLLRDIPADQHDKRYDASVSRNTRLRAIVRGMQSDAEHAAETARALAEHRSEPTVAAALARLQALKEKMAFNGDYTEEQVVAVEHAIAAWETLGADRADAKERLQGILGTEDALHTAKVNAYSEQVASATAALEALKGSAPLPKIKVEGGTLAERGHSLFMQMSQGDFPSQHTDRVYEAVQSNDPAAIEAAIGEYGEAA